MTSHDPDIAKVSVKVLAVEGCANRGRLIATASVEIDIDGLTLQVHGVRLMRQRDNSVSVELPLIRAGDGRLVPALVLPAEIDDAIHKAVVLEIVETVRERAQANGQGDADLSSSTE